MKTTSPFFTIGVTLSPITYAVSPICTSRIANARPMIPLRPAPYTKVAGARASSSTAAAIAAGSSRSSASVTCVAMYRCARTNVAALPASSATAPDLRGALRGAGRSSRRLSGDRTRRLRGRLSGALGPVRGRGYRLLHRFRCGRSVLLRPPPGERPLVEELHVHPVVLEERRARDDGDVVIPLGEDLGERIEPDEAALDRGQPELAGAVELDPGEVEVERPVGRGDELLDHRLELGGVLERAALPRREMRQVQHGHGPPDMADQVEDLLAGTEDVRVTARFDREPYGTLRVVLEPVREVRHDVGQLLDRIAPVAATVEAEVGDGEPRAESLGQHAGPLDLARGLLPGVARAEEVDVVRSVQRQVSVERARERLGLLEVGVVLGEAPGERRQRVAFLDRIRQRGERRRSPLMVRGTDVHDELEQELPREFPDLFIEREARERIDLDELDFHRREPEVVHIGDAVPKRAPLAGERDPRWSETDHE